MTAGNECGYRSISDHFGVGSSSVCVVVHEVCNAIADVLLHRYIKLPLGNQAMNVVSGIENRWGFPQCFGAIDGSHIPILLPVNNARDYYNQKRFYSIVVQALVNHRYHFQMAAQ